MIGGSAIAVTPVAVESWYSVGGLRMVKDIVNEIHAMLTAGVDVNDIAAQDIADKVWDTNLDTHDAVDTAGRDLTSVRAAEINHRVEDSANNTITIYEDDGITIRQVFDTVKDANGNIIEITPQ